MPSLVDSESLRGHPHPSGNGMGGTGQGLRHRRSPRHFVRTPACHESGGPVNKEGMNGNFLEDSSKT